MTDPMMTTSHSGACRTQRVALPDSERKWTVLDSEHGVSRRPPACRSTSSTASLRPRIEQLRAAAPLTATSAEQARTSDTQVARAMATQLRELKRRHHEEIT
jgi:hypothetical protein